MRNDYERFKNIVQGKMTADNYMDFLRQLRLLGMGPFYGIKLLRDVLGTSTAEAKRQVHFSGVWPNVQKTHTDIEEEA